MASTLERRPPAWFRIVGVLALIWNLIGVCFYLGHVGVLGPPFADTAAPAMPDLVTGAFAIGVFSGVIGSLCLVLARAWARPILLVSLIGSAVDWGWVIMAVGNTALPMGVTVIVIAALLVWLAHSGVRKGWLT